MIRLAALTLAMALGIALMPAACRRQVVQSAGGAETGAGTRAPADLRLPVMELAAPLDPDAKIDGQFRRELLPQVRRDTPLRLVVDLTAQPDLVALGRRLDARDRTRRERVLAAGAALAQRVPAATALADELRAMPAVTDVVEATCMARVSFTGPARLATELAARPGVLAVWGRATTGPPPPATTRPGGAVPPLARPAASWAIEAMRVAPAWERGLRGAGAHACIMDSLPAAEHPALAGRFARTDVAPPGAALPDDGAGHGLAVLGAAVAADGLGVAPEATWSGVNAIGQSGLDPEAIAAAVDWILLHARPDVVLVPWDVPDQIPAHALALPFGALRTAGMGVVFPAGNTGPSRGANRPPANLLALAPDGAAAFSIGGVDRAMGAYDLSNRGPNARDGSQFPLAAAPGADVVLPDPAGGVRIAHGTSQACGFAAGAMAIVLAAHPRMTGPQAEALLQATARDLGEPGPDTTFGHGILDVAAAVEAAATPSR